MKSNARYRQVPAASNGVPLIVSIVDHPHAVLPYIAVRRTLGFQVNASFLLLDGIVAVSREADKQAQESVTLYYITRNAAEPHDMVSRCWRDCSFLLVGNAHIRHLFLLYRGCGVIYLRFQHTIIRKRCDHIKK